VTMNDETRAQVRRAAARGMDRDWIARICAVSREDVDAELGDFPVQCVHSWEVLEHTRRCTKCGFAEPTGDMVQRIRREDMPTKKRGMV